MQSIIDLIRTSFSNEIALLIISMLPLIELKGSIPIGLAMDFTPFEAYGLSLMGSTIPAIFILLWIKPVFDWMKERKELKKIADWAEGKAFKRKDNIEKYEYLGLFLFVAIPLPGTGVWMGSLIASLLGLRRIKSFLVIACGNTIAGLIIYIFSSFFF
ncbi:small multi-drug export protein [Anaerococcus sp. AGMB00486]|uniref:Small multi-drug export protein n=2 Tax=Anaerococcus TaxID=165779 RepID=A0ABX2NB71_9FIRM|nr:MULTISPECIES: small multi-drug export protein [Anaerococcus]MDY3006996.1 small multi-drug export protein [Anaerococcus porci]MSS78183.1 small multi-drug export protein [Anaerococcus porci]NVF11941.1 small multi-drug export protein [Anaerococcus faecalis]